MARHSHYISIISLSLAIIISVREYYIEHQLQNSLETVDSESIVFNDSDYSGYEPIFSSDPILDSVPAAIPTVNVIQTVSANNTSDRQQLLQVGKGDTLGSLLTNIGITREEAEKATKALKKVVNLTSLKIGQAIDVRFKQDNNQGDSHLISINIKPNLEHEVVLTKNKQGQFNAVKNTVPLTRVLKRIEGNVQSNFYSAALKNGAPANIVKEAVSALSFNMNFQHGIQKGAPYEILYEVFHDKEGNLVKTGDLKYVALAASGTLHRVYHYKTKSSAGYYNAKGESVVRSLLQTPIHPSQMRVTSKFGLRQHPIMGYTCQHKGVDFGAPAGTDVMSAGDGVVTKAGYSGNYGLLVRIKHSGGYETVYAHLSKLGNGIRPGAVVRQKQIIGKVGSTGRATGPHLHHEVIHNNVHINPQNIKQLPTSKLAGKELAQFNLVKKEIETQIVGIPLKNQIVGNLTDSTITAG